MTSPDPIDPYSSRPAQLPEGTPAPQPAQGDAYELYTRLLLGLAVLGGDELLKRLRAFQAEYERQPEMQARFKSVDEETGADLLRYLLVGGLVRSQRAVTRTVRSGINFSFRSTAWALNTFYDLTDNFLLRPLQRPVDAVLVGSERAARSLVDEGRVEEQQGRALAGKTVQEVIDEFIAYISGNEELAELVRDQIGQQSIGLAGIVVDNSRRLTSTADSLLEGVVRRLLRLRSRGELPDSPLAGQPQLMYLPDEQKPPAEGGAP